MGQATQPATLAAQQEHSVSMNALGRCRLAAVRAQEVDRAAHRAGAGHREHLELAAGELLFDHQARHQADPGSGTDRALDRLAASARMPSRA